MDYRNYCEIDLGAIAHNYGEIKNKVGPHVKIMGIVKADAYGHGILRVSETLIKNGIDYLGVATLDEGLEVRQHFDIPIIILGFVPYNQIESAIKNNITQTIYSIACAEAISKVAKSLSKKAKVHIKIDTGMNRLGFSPCDIEDISKIKRLDNLDIEGIFTHFSCADSDKEYTKRQFELFCDVSSKLKNIFEIKYLHCCNSAGIANFTNMYLNMVRPGISLYGLSNTKSSFLKPAMFFKSQIVHLKSIPVNSKISYNGSFITKRDSIIATIPVGYADGYPRKLSNNINVLINGMLVPVVGRICMDYFLVDVTDINIKLFDEVVLFGCQGQKEISVNELADKTDTINYEIICSIGKRVPRIYVD